jgi:uncharacterized protein YjdB
VLSNDVALTTGVKDYPPIDALTIEPQNPVELPIRRQQKFVAVLRADDEAVQNVTDTALWTSDNEAVAVVDQQGLVQGVSIGTATITATNGAQQDTVEVVVNDATLMSVLIFPYTPADLPVGHTQVFTTGTGILKGTDKGGYFSDGVRRVLRGGHWSVSDDTVALIEQNESGLIAWVTGLAMGNVDVVYTDYDAEGTRTGIESIKPLNVSSNLLVTFRITPHTNFSVPVGNWTQFQAFGDYSDGTSREITDEVIWVSSDTSVGVFDIETKGRLTMLDVAVGSFTDASAEIVNTEDTLLHSNPAQTAVSVNGDFLTQLNIIEPTRRQPEVGKTVQFTATGYFGPSAQNDFTERATWSVNDPNIATVSNAPGTKGQVTGVTVSSTPFNLTAEDPDTQVTTTRAFYVSQQQP